MREIKFRAWDKKSKKMRQVTEIVFNTGFYLESDDNTVKLIWVKGQDIIENKEIQIQRQNDFELMQYTGLKDKNGKEIYESDLVEITRSCVYETGIVIYKNGCFFIKVKETLLPLYECEINNFKLKVIGSISERGEIYE